MTTSNATDLTGIKEQRNLTDKKKIHVHGQLHNYRNSNTLTTEFIGFEKNKTKIK